VIPGSLALNPAAARPDETAPLPSTSSQIQAFVRVPGSKSITNRALLAASLAEGPSVITGALFSDDTRYMAEAVRRAGIAVEERTRTEEFKIPEGGRRPGPVADSIFLGNAGTAMRFLSSFFTLGQGRYRLDGTPRMRERPIQELIDALNTLGAEVRSELGTGCPPVVIEAHGPVPGGIASMPSLRSSQFASSVLLSAPYFEQGVDLEILGRGASHPYFNLTADVMAAFGVPVEYEAGRRFRVKPGRYRGRHFAVEPDASSASYFLAAAAITGGSVVIPGLSTRSRQGDMRFARILQQMGCGLEDTSEGLRLTAAERLSGVDVDMNDCSDVSLTLAAIAPFCSGPAHIRNVAHLRLQETDRIHAVVTEWRRAGIRVEQRTDGFSIYPGEPRPAIFESYDDHRMAMSLSLIGLRTPGCFIRNPGCVSKTVPDYFERLQRAITGQPEPG
jgi:3-phosphoshikimate 1-carboxyvinyltransferase